MIYLDNSATTNPYEDVIDSLVTVSRKFYGNPSSLHKLGGEAERLLTHSRETTAKLLNVKPNEITFNSGGTEGNNHAIKGIAFANRNRGKHIITTTIEHPSVTEACKQLEEIGYDVTYIPVNLNGIVQIDDVKKAIRDDTILVSIIHVNNEIGSVQPIAEIGKLLKSYPKIIFHVDHVQGVGKVPLDLKRNFIDLCSMSGHKFHGLKGNGILYIREGVTLSPLLAGGSQEYNNRSGTENVAGIVAMTKALRLTLENYQMKIKDLVKIKEAYMDELSKLPFITLNTSTKSSAPHIINMTIHGIKPEVFVHSLEEEQIYLSTTSACSSKKRVASKTLLAMGKNEREAESAIRISLSYNNSIHEVPTVLTAIRRSAEKLRLLRKI
ncbi:cysteine desulfurase family protein [Cytobacillus sp. IB215665]|uniref:cysteine desulfurase family protein n=1 Tax=Cytobacillus sp. IB215665 TaxID=3097357 RepID=UPI002A165E40|nr:cysteine desulfurase family protein [Cytobacillus sp. IB215665]MDX8367512.1 cysteine desulfurase family protein [Cytobacillus sp. IB215665]